jgi:hypothetical protein
MINKNHVDVTKNKVKKTATALSWLPFNLMTNENVSFGIYDT